MHISYRRYLLSLRMLMLITISTHLVLQTILLHCIKELMWSLCSRAIKCHKKPGSQRDVTTLSPLRRGAAGCDRPFGWAVQGPAPSQPQAADPPAGSQLQFQLTPAPQNLSSQQALLCLQAAFHQAWLGAQQSLPSVFAKSLCININHFYSLHTTLAELSVLMFPSRADTQLCFSSSKANSRAP